MQDWNVCFSLGIACGPEGSSLRLHKCGEQCALLCRTCAPLAGQEGVSIVDSSKMSLLLVMKTLRMQSTGPPLALQSSLNWTSVEAGCDERGINITGNVLASDSASVVKFCAHLALGAWPPPGFPRCQAGTLTHIRATRLLHLVLQIEVLSHQCERYIN